MLRVLRGHGNRVTEQRRLICQALLEVGGHPTAYDVHGRVTANAPTISLATVYTALNALRDAGLIFDLGTTGDGRAHYEVNSEPHANFVCTVCGRIEDVFDVPVGDLRNGVARRGHDVRGMRVVLYGTCADCKSRLTSGVSAN